MAEREVKAFEYHIFKLDWVGNNLDGSQKMEVHWSMTDAPADVKVEDVQICVVMVGLPARGKSLIAQKSESEHLEEFSLHR